MDGKMSEQSNQIPTNLTQRMEEYELVGKVTFDDSALEELSRLSGGVWDQASLYAGSAMLNALYNQRNVITSRDVVAADESFSEIIKLSIGKVDLWNIASKITNSSIPMTTEDIALKIMLADWDADHELAYDLIRDGKLPGHVDLHGIEYQEILDRPATVIIPFLIDPSNNEVEAVAQNLANFVSQHTGETQAVVDASNHNSIRYNVQPAHILGHNPSYIVEMHKPGPFSPPPRSIYLSRSSSTKHDTGTLEAYVLSVKQLE